MKRIAFLIVLISTANLLGQTPVSKETTESVKWLTFEEAVALNKKEKKLIFIDVYTTWCGPCKMMDKFTFSDPEVAPILNRNFYPVKLNAEQRENIMFNGNTFKFVDNGASGYHELAAALLGNKLQYPTFVFMTEDMKIMQAIAGYHKAPEFHKIIQFIGEGYFKKMKWQDWEAIYKSPFAPPSQGSGK